MLAKNWKKIGLIILIIACLFNIINKLVHSTNLVEELESSAEYIPRSLRTVHRYSRRKSPACRPESGR